jgi:hypothetical protein
MIQYTQYWIKVYKITQLNPSLTLTLGESVKSLTTHAAHKAVFVFGHNYAE